MPKNKLRGPEVKATPDALIEAVMLYEKLRADPDRMRRLLFKNVVEHVRLTTGVSRPVLLKAVAKRQRVATTTPGKQNPE